MTRIFKIGTVVSDKMQKTRVVKVLRVYRHKKYDKTLREAKKYYAHDENNISKIGDKVKIEFSKPISKLKRWKVLEIIK
ncbi:MAG: 30S ribosomal protein S17 [Endomicrobiia bacterium]